MLKNLVNSGKMAKFASAFGGGDGGGGEGEGDNNIEYIKNNNKINKIINNKINIKYNINKYIKYNRIIDIIAPL